MASGVLDVALAVLVVGSGLMLPTIEPEMYVVAEQLDLDLTLSLVAHVAGEGR